MKHDIVPAWMWLPPGDIIEELIEQSAWRERRAQMRVSRETKCGAEPAEASAPKDRYYTMARRAHVRALPKEKP